MNVQPDLFEGKPLLTADRLRELLHYCPEGGAFTWRVDYGRKAKKGSRAGSIDPKGYRIIRIMSHGFRAHRLAWLYMTGNHPQNQIDHRNNVKDDNSWKNLRLATNGQNMANSPIRRDNRFGATGIYLRKSGRWRAYIDTRKRRISLGTFANKEAAIAARKAAEIEYHGDFAYNKHD